jgi:hypothetical protein
MTDFSKTLIRCSSIGSIMTKPRGKTNAEKYQDAIDEMVSEMAKYDAMPNKALKTATNKLEKIAKLELEVTELSKIKDEVLLSDTCKSYLVQSYVLSKYGRVREIQTKQMVKGTISEDDSIQLFAALEKKPYSKNIYRLNNPYISGCPDLYDGETIVDSNEIIDVKSCWDIFTFLSNVEAPENDMYYWQLQGYMALTGAKIGTIAYCLVNTPDSIIEGEKYNLLRRMDVATEEDAGFKREYAKLMANRKFDDIPMSERLLTYSIERNDDDIDKIYKKVEKCREFLSEFEEKHKLFSKEYRKKIKPEEMLNVV